MRVRQLVRDGDAALVRGDVAVDVGLGIEGEIDARDAERAHAVGQRHRLGAHGIGRKVPALLRREGGVEPIGDLPERVRADDVAVRVPLHAIGQGVELLHIVLRRGIGELVRDGDGREPERGLRGQARIQGRVQDAEGDEHGQSRRGEAVQPPPHAREVAVMQQDEQPDDEQHRRRDEKEGGDLVQREGKQPRDAGKQPGQKAGDAPREEVLGEDGDVGERKQQRRRQYQEAQDVQAGVPPHGIDGSHASIIPRFCENTVTRARNFFARAPSAPPQSVSFPLPAPFVLGRSPLLPFRGRFRALPFPFPRRPYPSRTVKPLRRRKATKASKRAG